MGLREALGSCFLAAGLLSSAGSGKRGKEAMSIRVFWVNGGKVKEENLSCFSVCFVSVSIAVRDSDTLNLKRKVYTLILINANSSGKFY